MLVANVLMELFLWYYAAEERRRVIFWLEDREWVERMQETRHGREIGNKIVSRREKEKKNLMEVCI